MESSKKIFGIQYTYSIHYSHEYIDNSEFSIVSIEEDDMPPQFFFTSDLLTEINNPIEIWAKGLFLLNLYNGMVNIFYPKNDWDSCVQFNRLYEWSSLTDITPKNTNKITPLNPYTENIQIELTSKEIKELKNSNYLVLYSFLAKHFLDVQSILLLASNSLNWVTLYCIYDTINYYSSNFSELVESCGFSNKDIKSFTGTANNFGLLGINSRHGQMGFKNPKRIMNIEDARKLILTIAKKYLDNKEIS